MSNGPLLLTIIQLAADHVTCDLVQVEETHNNALCSDFPFYICMPLLKIRSFFCV